MESWFSKAVIANATIAPVFITIPIFTQKWNVEPLVFVVWYFAGTAAGTALFFAFTGRAGELLPGTLVLVAMVFIGLSCGAIANSLLFVAVGSAPNPGLRPVIYAASSIVVFAASALLASMFPELLKPVSTEWTRFLGILLVLLGLYLLAGGRLL